MTGSAPSVSRSASPPLVVRKGRFAIHSDSDEHIRLEGYLTNSEFVAALRSGFGRIASVQKSKIPSSGIPKHRVLDDVKSE